MLLRCCALLISMLAGLNVAPAAAEVFLRVTAGALPSARELGVNQVVVRWPVQDDASLSNLSALGFRVFLEAASNDLPAAIAAAEHAHLAGLIVKQAGTAAAFDEETFRSLQEAHPKLLFRSLILGGKQPQMRGRLVVNRDGILQVSSPSSQPWLDTNLAAVRLAKTFSPAHTPVLYDFPWDLSDTVHQEFGPNAEQFALAISEAAAIRADVILDLPRSLQNALAAHEPAAWSLWNQVTPYLIFSHSASTDDFRPVANIGVVACDAQANYEAINLLARHNLAFETVQPTDLTPRRAAHWSALVLFCAPQNPQIGLLNDFANRGGIVVLVNQRGDYPWHAHPASRTDERSSTFTIGSGQIVELHNAVTDPEDFARDLRRLLGAHRTVLTLWNSLTTLVTGYRRDSTGETILHVINYNDVPDNVQIQIQGHFASVQLEAPETSGRVVLPTFERDGFTEFTISRLVIASRVLLVPAETGKPKQ